MLDLARWRREWRATDRLHVTAPDGNCELAIHERERPLAPLRAILAARAGGLGTVAAEKTSTVEGELAVLITLGGAGPLRVLGVVYGDDFQTVIEGRAVGDDQRERIVAATREMVQRLPLGLGQFRYRWCWYRPPEGWQGRAHGLVTDWYPLDHPRNPSTIRVMPARPLESGTFQFDTFLRDQSFDDVKVDEVVQTPFVRGPIKGTIARVTAGTRAFLTAGLEDQRFIYALRLTTTTAQLAVDEPVFLQVVNTCEPPPSPLRAQTEQVRALNFWAM